VTRRLLDRFADLRAPTPELAGLLEELTPREREVLVLVGSGLTNAEIAERLVLSPLTAKTHVSRVMVKLAAHDRAQLVIAAYEGGLVSPSGSWPNA
jgi:DNA-binding NarL/FixJ family response regulator